MQKQQLQQSLQQRLSPQQIQLIRMLELPAIEMEERIKQELEENPALEEGRDPDTIDEEPAESTDEDASLTDLGDYLTDDDIPEYRLRAMNNAEERREEIPFSTGPSMHDYLEEQLGLRHLTDREQEIGRG